MKVVIPGGSGQVGTLLARHFHNAGHHVVVLSRKTGAVPWQVVPWDGETLGEWVRELEGADALINLTGRSVNCRYSYKNKCEIWASRTRSVRVLGKAVASLKQPPPVWLQAATATIYRNSYDTANDEYTGSIGGFEDDVPEKWRFSIDVARAWEGEFALCALPHTRKVILRSALTLSPDRGGIFDYLLWLVRIGLGGAAGSGRQYVSWVHYEDFIRAVEFLIHNEQFEGVVNIAAPNPIPNKVFMAALRAASGRRLGLPAYRWMLALGSIVLRTETELILKSRRVLPRRLTEAGFSFQFPEWPEAARDLCTRRAEAAGQH